jgi:hypothetical protein
MIIVSVEGGLGNQMFQYALYLSFISRGIKAKLDISRFNTCTLHNGYELEKVFNVQPSYCTVTERRVIKSLSKLLHVITNRPYKEEPTWQWIYHKEVHAITFGFLKGYWQSEKYFLAAAGEVRKKLRFPVLQDERSKEVLSKMLSSNSVSLHIRRGDYLQGDRNCSLNPEYYHTAIATINQQVSNPYYFICSDDIEWARNTIDVQQAEFVDWNRGDRSYVDMQLMSSCKHNIIANSSFSWWGAWLNSHAGKLVIAPKKWLPALQADSDVIPGGWIKLPSGFTL